MTVLYASTFTKALDRLLAAAGRARSDALFFTGDLEQRRLSDEAFARIPL